MSVFRFTHAIARAPGRSVVGGLKAGDHAPPVYDGVVAEHVAYVAALAAAGVEVEVLPPLEAYPDSMFVEDPALVFPGVAILLRPGAPSRLGEVGELRPALAGRFDRLLILPEGHADGGDVLVTPAEILIGLSSRTDAAGAAALATLLRDEIGRPARVVSPPAGVLHLKSACALLDDETVLATPPLAASGLFGGLQILTTPPGEEAAANLIRVNDVVLASAEHPRTLDLIRLKGLEVAPLHTAEIARIDAGLSCMSLRWAEARGEPGNA